MADDLLRTQKLRKEFGGLVAVDDVDFDVPRGSIVSLIGPNGAGKTTFFNMLTGVYKPTAGLVHFDGEDMTGRPPHAFTQRGIGRTFQNMTALENVLVGMHVRLKGTLFGAILRTPRIRKEERDARRAIRVADLLNEARFAEKLRENLDYHNFVLTQYLKADAVDFQKTVRAIEYCVRERIPDAQIVLKFGADRQFDIVLPIRIPGFSQPGEPEFAAA